ncbi:iron complex transport system ATP-binding protein [Agrococcus baldri]|uniref:Iron complex transport system ATP-binding protein n=1 Tax=Agrococcus baldri TaxID=153730 RepID=A0AA94KYH6_9MICO|nr:ABC transporter ATP-binding protein [Agrococcus baldri]SFR98777.1 iron complex transport system ATP-binding protein [Agrococcus baldri]
MSGRDASGRETLGREVHGETQRGLEVRGETQRGREVHGETQHGLEVRGLTIAVPGRTLVDDASWSAPTGQITALVGPNGAGKSTMLRAIAGVVPERATVRGEVHLSTARGATGRLGTAGLDTVRLDTVPARERARRVALVEQLADAVPQLTAREAVRLGRTPHHRMLGFSIGDDGAVEAALADAGATTLAERRLGALSGGELQRVHIARALAQQAGSAPGSALLLDEPTNHLDVAWQLDLLELVRRLAADRPVVLTVHDLALAATHADRVVLVDGGRVIAAGDADAVLTSDRIRSVYGVEASIDAAPDGVAIRYRRIDA